MGKIEIGNDRAGFLRIIENPIDLVVKRPDVSGNLEIIYEKGTGYNLLADFTHWDFNIINVWKLQTDGFYKM